MAVWCVGTIAWSIVYGDRSHPPYPTVADIFWLLWYPLTVIGIVLLIRVRFQRFELHRWMDGVAVVLIVLVAGFAARRATDRRNDDPGLAGHHRRLQLSGPRRPPDRGGARCLRPAGLEARRHVGPVGCGILAMTSADAAFAVQRARGVVEQGHYDFVWTIGALLLAYAGLGARPDAHDDDRQVTGMRAIALALIAQALAIGIQIYAFFEEVGGASGW